VRHHVVQQFNAIADRSVVIVPVRIVVSILLDLQQFVEACNGCGSGAEVPALSNRISYPKDKVDGSCQHVSIGRGYKMSLQMLSLASNNSHDVTGLWKE